MSKELSGNMANSTNKGKDVRFVTQRPLEVEVDSRIYNMNRGIRKAIVFNHDATTSSHGTPKTRPGTEHDVNRLKTVLDLFNFTVTVYEDLNRNSLLQKLEELQADNYDDCDCLAILVLTHGSGNKLSAQDKPYPMEELWNHFSSDACRTLAGKPKLVFINACRGEKRDFGVEFAGDITIDGPKPEEESNSYQIIYTIPNYADILIAFSTFDGYISHRPDEGSWFIQVLCDVLMEHKNKNMEIKQLLTIVTQKVALKTHHTRTKQVPVIVSTLRHDLYL